MPSGQPRLAEALSITTTVRCSSPKRPAIAIASWLLPSSNSPSPISTTTRAVRPSARSPSAVPTPSGSPWPSDPLLISTPGTSTRSGCRPSGEPSRVQASSASGSMKPFAESTA